MPSLPLKHYQDLFCQAMFQAEQGPYPLQLLNAFHPGGTLTADHALEVYSRGHVARLTEALGETFEAVWWVAGDEAFFRLAKNFILAHPSTFYNLSSYGRTFSDYLKKETPFPNLPFLPHLARYEWTFKEMFHTRFVNEVEEPEFQVLQHLQNGECVEDALALTLERFPQLSQEQVSALFQLIIHPGIVEECHTKPSLVL